MSKEEKLRKILDKAYLNGYLMLWIAGDMVSGGSTEYYRVLFSHDFAKAFWGENREACEVCVDKVMPCRSHIGGDYSGSKFWKHHLQEMVISEDPIEYAYKFVEEE